jgi:hypothetical protein
MKSEKEKLSAKTVDQLKAAAKRLGGKLVTPDGKAKTKQQLINTIVMKQRLAGKSMGGNTNTKKVVAKKTVAKKATVKKVVKKSTLGQSQERDKGVLLRAFEVIVLPKTSTMKARVKINDYFTQESKTIPYVADGSGGGYQAQKYLNTLGFKIFAYAYSPKGEILLTKNFEKSIKDKA